MKRNFKWILVIALAIVGLGLMLVEPLKTNLISSYHPHITRKQVQHNQSKRANYNLNQVKTVTLSQVLRARLHTNGVKTVGQIVVPRAHLHLPIGLGVDNNTLMLAAGTMRQHQRMGMGNYALAGHHMIDKKILFSPLYYRAPIGTTVYLTDMNKLYEYRINVRKIISPYDLGVIDNTKRPIVTLITCNVSGSRRLLLQGKLVKTVKLAQAPKKLVSEMRRSVND